MSNNETAESSLSEFCQNNIWNMCEKNDSLLARQFGYRMMMWDSLKQKKQKLCFQDQRIHNFKQISIAVGKQYMKHTLCSWINFRQIVNLRQSPKKYYCLEAIVITFNQCILSPFNWLPNEYILKRILKIDNSWSFYLPRNICILVKLY